MTWTGLFPWHWMPYVAVDAVDGSLTRAADLGGHVCMPAMDNPPHGRFAVIDDPQGAYLSLLQQPDPQPVEGPGTFGWEELLTPDPEGAARFYRGLFGWTVGADGQVSHGGREIGALRSSGEPAAWLPGVRVEDVDRTAERAVRLGAELRPGAGPGRVIVDPTGARIALVAAGRA